MPVDSERQQFPPQHGGRPYPRPAAAEPETAARLLGERLRDMRTSRGTTMREAAEAVRGSVSKISRLERALTPPRERDVKDLLHLYAISPSQRQEVLNLLRQAQGSSWHEEYQDVTPSYLKRLIGLEAAADRVAIYENHVVPGPLQTDGYAFHVLEAVMPGDQHNRRRRELRAGRREKLLGDSGPAQGLFVVLDESALHRTVGGAACMVEQLDFLREAHERKLAQIRIVEFGNSVGVSPPYPITSLRYPADSPSEVMYVEHIDSAMYLTRAADIDRYRKALHRVFQGASDRERTVELLTRAKERYLRARRCGEPAAG
ncbi:helix-turn-helix domain-containing protein [Streptomyces sp. NPDC007088]|uniref:helix-turn-helix domain-containing protein n=1 Tax=Streptomyces sp. NPDC007088 TaxID=3364773 RepID=UPI0036ADC883